MKELLAMAFQVALALGLYTVGLFVVLIMRNALMSRYSGSVGFRTSEHWYSTQ
jgi:hypothetical protein